jgi:signal transduction histidine kinase
VGAIERLRRLDPMRADALLAVLLLAVAQAEIWLTSTAAGRQAETAAAAALMCGALAFRRRAPLATALAVDAAVLGLGLLAEIPNVVFLAPVGLTAMYSLGSYATPERAVIGLAVTLVALPLSAIRTEDAAVTDLTAPALLFAAAWATGRALRARRLRAAELEDKTDRLVREQDEREHQAAAEERRRIARELHDIVAHRVTTIVIQAESGAATADDPARARHTFATIAGSGREALDELRRLLGLLRDDDERAVTAPQPSLARLDELVADARRAGLPVEARIEGPLDGLPAGVDLTAYRILQESLTNALRHARTVASVLVRRDPGELVVEVRNRIGPVSAANGHGAGRGLAGMHERVRVYDGELTAGPAGADWVVRAELPLREGER